MPSTVFLDECGYTGDDLLDPEQPVFTIATHDFSDHEALELKREFFSHVKAPELKHTQLQGRHVHQAAVYRFLAGLERARGRVRIAFASKLYAATGKLVDCVIEPIARRDGFKLYEQSQNVALSSLLFYVLQAGGSDVLRELLARFQRLIRAPGADVWNAFFEYLFDRHPVGVIDETLDLIRGPASRLRPSDITSLPRHPLDLSLTVALNCVYSWRQAGVVPKHLVHDASTNMRRQEALWQAILSPTAPAALIGNGRTTVEFPIGVEETRFVSSGDSPGIQIADVIAGATTRWAKWLARGAPKEDLYAAELDKFFSRASPEFVVSTIWPDSDPQPIDTPDGVQDPLEYLIERVRDSG